MEEKNFENEATPKFCPQCGSPLSPEAKFCPKCGKVLGEAAQEAENVVQEAGQQVEQATQTVTNATTTSANGANDFINKVAEKTNPFADKLEAKEIDIAGQKFTLLQIIIFAAALVNVISLFLPFVRVSLFGYSVSASWIQGSGWFPLILAVAVGVLTYLKQKMIALIVAGVNFIFTLYTMIRGLGEMSGYGHLSIGAWLAFLASLALVAMAALSFLKDKTTK